MAEKRLELLLRHDTLVGSVAILRSALPLGARGQNRDPVLHFLPLASCVLNRAREVAGEAARRDDLAVQMQRDRRLRAHLLDELFQHALWSLALPFCPWRVRERYRGGRTHVG